MTYKIKKLIFGILLVLALPSLYLISINLEFQKSNFKVIKGTLEIDPEFNKNSKGRTYLVLNLQGYRNKFHTNSFSFHVLKKKELKSNVKKGDEVFLSIMDDESMSYEDKINLKMNIVGIMELWTENENYISIEDYNNYKKKDFKLSYLFWLIALVYYSYWVYKNNTPQQRV
jgi:hypothetical protein